MQKFHTVVQSIILFAFMSQTHGAFALDSSGPICPSVEQLSEYNYQEGSVDKYVKNDQKVIFDAEFEKDDGEDRLWILELRSMTAKAGDELQDIAQASLEKLVLVSPQPFLTESFSGIFEDSYVVPVCIYTSTENDTITAFARYLDFSDHNGTDSDREEIKKRVMTRASQKLHK